MSGTELGMPHPGSPNQDLIEGIGDPVRSKMDDWHHHSPSTAVNNTRRAQRRCWQWAQGTDSGPSQWDGMS